MIQFVLTTKSVQFKTNGEIVIDLTPELHKFQRSTPISQGEVKVFVIGSTGAVGTAEYEPYLTRDNEVFGKDHSLGRRLSL